MMTSHACYDFGARVSVIEIPVLVSFEKSFRFVSRVRTVQCTLAAMHDPNPLLKFVLCSAGLDLYVLLSTSSRPNKKNKRLYGRQGFSSFLGRLEAYRDENIVNGVKIT